MEKYQVKKMRELPASERPREKLKKYGPDILKNYELLAIILGKGSKKEDVLSLSKRIMEQYGNLPFLKLSSFKKIQELFGLSFVQTCQIIAVFELGKRIFSKSKEVFLRNPEEVYEYLKDMKRLKKENFRGLYLDTRNRLIRDEVISVGTLNASLVHPREVFEPAFKYGACALILAHNHPSGDASPSKEDIKITNQLIKVSKIMEIEILDHIIIGEENFVSLKEIGILK